MTVYRARLAIGDYAPIASPWTSQATSGASPRRVTCRLHPQRETRKISAAASVTAVGYFTVAHQTPEGLGQIDTFVPHDPAQGFPGFDVDGDVYPLGHTERQTLGSAGLVHRCPPLVSHRRFLSLE